MVNFVLAGKAGTVFDLIKKKAEREAGNLCPRDPRRLARCTKPEDVTCAESRCPVYLEVIDRKAQEIRDWQEKGK
jgi:hypothetical protein